MSEVRRQVVLDSEGAFDVSETFDVRCSHAVRVLFDVAILNTADDFTHLVTVVPGERSVSTLSLLHIVEAIIYIFCSSFSTGCSTSCHPSQSSGSLGFVKSVLLTAFVTEATASLMVLVIEECCVCSTG
jgi:hypothetical protein